MKSGEIWLVNFSPSVGNEINKVRPAVVVSNDNIGSLDLRVVVPITGTKKNAREWHIKIRPNDVNKLTKEGVIDCFQVKSFAEERFRKKIGTLSDKEMDSVKLSLAAILDLL